MSYTVKHIANWFLSQVDRESGDSITPLKLQKLLYYAQSWALALLDRPLFDDDFEAWAHGPVAPAIYGEYKSYGWNAIDVPADEVAIAEDDDRALLEEVYRVYGEKRAKTLEMLTHQEDPWKNARGGCEPEGICKNVISKESMKIYYKMKYEQAQKEA